MEELTKLLQTSLGGYSLSHILSALLTLLVCLVAARLLLKLTKRLLHRVQRLNDRLRQIILTALKVVLYLLTGIITAEALGLNTSSLTALVSVLTLGVTLAAEDILGNVAGGLVILSSHPFNIGDEIEVSGTTGTVREITLNHTKLETADGHFIMQPNKELSSSRIVNYTALGRRRVVRRITASYDAPTDTVKAACLEAVAATPGTLEEPAPAVYLTDYGSSAIEYSVRCWTKAEDYWTAYFALNENLRTAFAAHGVEMTYDHLNVHMVSAPPSQPHRQGELHGE
jgi:small conductance mechanosensitive channel